MRVRSLVIAVAVMFGVLIVGRFMGWIGKGPGDLAAGGSGAPSNPTATESTPHPEASNPVPSPTPGQTDPGASAVAASNPNGNPAGVSRTPVTPPSPLSPGTTPAPAGQITDWEQRIDDVLTAQGDENSKVKKLLEIFPNLPEDGQVEAAQHLSNLLPDEEYPALANTLTNAHAAEAVLDVLMTDVLNRPNPIKLTTLLDVARTPEHPKAAEARDVLEVFVDEDYGNNWAAWSDAIQKWLKENPDE